MKSLYDLEGLLVAGGGRYGGRGRRLPITVGSDSFETPETITSVREAIADADTAAPRSRRPADPRLARTSPPPSTGPTSRSSSTIGVVAPLLLLTYRSPVLGLVPLVVVDLTDGVAVNLTTVVFSVLGLSFDRGVISVLVFAPAPITGCCSSPTE